MISGSSPYFDKVADDYAAWYLARSPDGHALRVRQDRVLELLGQTKGRVLDVGCGPGVLGRELLDRGFEFWGVDASPAMVQECRGRLGGDRRARFVVGDATRLPFPDGFFDAVICMGVIGNVDSGASAVRELTRVAREGGTLLVTLPNPTSPYAAWKSLIFYPVVALFRSIYYRAAGKPQPPALYRFAWRRRRGASLLFFPGLHTARAARDLMSRHGANVTATTYFYFNVVLSPLDQWFPLWAMALCERLERLRFGRLKWLGAGFVLRATAGAPHGGDPRTEREECRKR